jgi:proliferating cell nuclear antigen
MADARMWKSIVTAVSTLIDEGTFEAGQDGIKLRAMDPSHVAMIDLSLPSSFFEEYVCDKPAKISVNFGEMLKLLRRVSGDESLEMNYEEDTAKLTLRLRGRYSRTFRMSTIQPSAEEVPTPKITFNAKIKMSAETLKNAVDDASAVSDHLRLESNAERLTINSSGDLGTATIELEKGSESVLSYEVQQDSKATFSISYLNDIIKSATAASDIVTVEYSTNMPIKLTFDLPQGSMVFYLAPRVEA